MPCACGNRLLAEKQQKLKHQAVQKRLQQLKLEQEKKNKLIQQRKLKQEVLEKKKIIDLSHNTPCTDPTISSINITGGSLNIKYNCKGGPAPAPTKGIYRGLLNETAYKAAGGESYINSGGRAVTYFPIGLQPSLSKGASFVPNLKLNDLDLSTYTHINIAFFGVNNDGHIVFPGKTSNDFSVPPNFIGGTQLNDSSDLWWNKIQGTDFAYVLNLFKELDEQRKNSNNPTVHILPSIGGWNIANDPSYNGYFWNLAADASNDANGQYKTFSNDLNQLLDYIDGIDIDWEYPGRGYQASLCQKGSDSNNSFPCPLQGPDAVVTCPPTKPDCITYKITASSQECYRPPSNNPEPYTVDLPAKTTISGEDMPTYNSTYANNYGNLLNKIKTDIIDKNNKNELSIAMAGALWGFHWYANTVSNLLKGEIIDFANLMTYDYGGYWSGGIIGLPLANLTNFKNLPMCTKGSGDWEGCLDLTKPEFSVQDNKLTPINNWNNEGGCPLTLWNTLYSDKPPVADIPINYNKGYHGNWWTDDGFIQNSTPRITQSIETFVNLFTSTELGGFGISKDKLNLGLPYYGRNFQSKGFKNQKGYGMFQAYDYGDIYNYYDLHVTYIAENATYKGKVYTLPMTSSYDENIIYNESKDTILNPLTNDMKQESITYSSITSTKQKISWLKNDIKLGGYMSWHALSDYLYKE